MNRIVNGAGEWSAPEPDRQHVTGGDLGINGVGLAAVAADPPVRSGHFEDRFAVGPQETGEPGAVATRALDSPDPILAELLRPLE